MMVAEGIRIGIGQLKRCSMMLTMSMSAAKGGETNLRLTGRVLKPTVYLPSGAMPKP